MGTRDKIKLCCYQSTTTACEFELLAELLTQNSKEGRGQVSSFPGCASAQERSALTGLSSPLQRCRNLHF